ncbi:MAG: COR domain-containing protein [Thiotrichaceae bacterium]|nr:COR domain-containing protein [Thiotrichaceae bacterium]
MTDLDIIKQLEQEIGRKLKKQDEIHFNSVGYIINAQNQVIGLSLYDCEIKQIPECLCSLIYLQKLYLMSNKIEQLPASFGQLQNLSELDLDGNQLKELPASFGQLQNLSELRLYNNQLKELPASFGQLQNLSVLWLNGNQLKELPASLLELENLQQLYLNSNKISELPKEILKLNLEILWESRYIKKGIALENNPLTSPPPEVIKQGRQAIIDYFNALEEETKKPLNEIKILLVGDGSVGKTSLVKALLGLPFDLNESQTHGININPHPIQTQNKQGENIEVTGHLWDFGGQEIMHATHQFFLSKRSLYILVLDGRKEQKTEYWLKHIESFGGDSPVLVVINKVDENPGFEVDRPFLQRKYPSIHSFHRASCKKSTGIKTLQKSLIKALTEIKILQTIWAQSWFNVKTELENLQQHYISYEYYKNLCEKHKIVDSAQTTLVHFLRDLGIILHFDEFELCDTYVLEPKWVTEAIYKIINSPQLAENNGIFQLKWLNDILNDNDRYPRDKYHYIIRLMEKFELCYKIDDNETILIPDLLEVHEPTFDFDCDNTLKFKLEYNFLPRAIMPRFIVKRHREILNKLCWRTGVVLYNKMNQATAVIKADNEDKNIQIWVTGQQKRDYFATVRQTLWEIHDSFEKINVKELIPLPDNPNYTVEYIELIGYYELGQEQYLVGKLKKFYSVKQLLDGIEDMSKKDGNTTYNIGEIKGANFSVGENNQQTMTHEKSADRTQNDEKPSPKFIYEKIAIIVGAIGGFIFLLINLDKLLEMLQKYNIL